MIGRPISLLIMGAIVTWSAWWVSVRIAEADNPGPADADSFRIVSANITSLSMHAEALKKLNANVISLQETRLNEFGQRYFKNEFREGGWELLCGKPQPR